MPVYNESKNIVNFVSDIFEVFGDEIKIVLVNDCSTDSTLANLEKLDQTRLHIIDNKVNLGHGKSTLRGLTEAIKLNPDYVISTDGDGQVDPLELHRMYKEMTKTNFGVIEGERLFRNDGWLRTIISSGTRFLIRVRSGVRTGDANTPHKVYELKALECLISGLNKNSIIPNLWISLKIRTSGMRYSSIPIESRDRPGEKIGSTWSGIAKHKRVFRLLWFCIQATREWFSQQ
jgi:glycosyltransferase involved in cell wall biosynthesis